MLPSITENYKPRTKGTREDHRREFWMFETGTGQQVAQPHEQLHGNDDDDDDDGDILLC